MIKSPRMRAVEERIAMLTRIEGAVVVVEEVAKVSDAEGVAIFKLIDAFTRARLMDVQNVDRNLFEALRDIERTYMLSADGTRVQIVRDDAPPTTLWRRLITVLPQMRAVVIGAPLPPMDLRDCGDLDKIVDSRLAYDDMRDDPLAAALRGEHSR